MAKRGEVVVAYVAKHPGQSVEQIKKALGVEKKALQLPIIRLIEAKKLKTTGQKRGTRYFVKQLRRWANPPRPRTGRTRGLEGNLLAVIGGRCYRTHVGVYPTLSLKAPAALEPDPDPLS